MNHSWTLFFVSFCILGQAPKLRFILVITFPTVKTLTRRGFLGLFAVKHRRVQLTRSLSVGLICNERRRRHRPLPHFLSFGHVLVRLAPTSLLRLSEGFNGWNKFGKTAPMRIPRTQTIQKPRRSEKISPSASDIRCTPSLIIGRRCTFSLWYRIRRINRLGDRINHR